MTRPNGCIIYEGPSRIDGQPIVAIATGLAGHTSRNTKTGHMVQTWIVRADIDPIQALRTGDDASICGGCQHRPRTHDGTTYGGRSCYVNVAQAPLVVYKAYRRGSYPVASYSDLATIFAGHMVRFGSYGDPAAIPVIYWQAIQAVASGTTGYTHQWKNAKLRDTLSACQLSADTEKDTQKAMTLGVGSFRVKHADMPILAGEVVCPASAEADKVATCDTCRMCSGGTAGRNIVINAHGANVSQFQPRTPKVA